jgi:hypothetical protein
MLTTHFTFPVPPQALQDFPGSDIVAHRQERIQKSIIVPALDEKYYTLPSAKQKQTHSEDSFRQTPGHFFTSRNLEYVGSTTRPFHVLQL